MTASTGSENTSYSPNSKGTLSTNFGTNRATGTQTTGPDAGKPDITGNENPSFSQAFGADIGDQNLLVTALTGVTGLALSAARAYSRANQVGGVPSNFGDKAPSGPDVFGSGDDGYSGITASTPKQQGKLAAVPAIVKKKPIASVVAENPNTNTAPSSVNNAKLGTATPTRKLNTTRAPLSFSTGAFKTALGS